MALKTPLYAGSVPVPVAQAIDVANICNAYESGVGHRGRPTANVNPYPAGSHEHKAYALGAAGEAVHPAAHVGDAEVISWAYEKLKGYCAGGPGSANEPLMERLRLAGVPPAEAKVADDVRLGNRLYVWDHENPEDGVWDNIEEYLHDTTPGVGDVVMLNLAMPLQDVEVEMLEVGRSGEPIRWQVRDVKTGAMLAAKATGDGT